MKVGASTVKTIKGMDSWWAWKLGATQKHASQLNVISLHTAMTVLQKLGAQPASLASLESLKTVGHYTILQLPQEVLELNCEPNLNPSTIKVPTPLPQVVLLCPVPTARLGERYGLPQIRPYLARAAVLTMQLAEFKQWVTNDFQLDRKGGALQHASWENVLNSIYLFLGYCNKWHGVQQPTLQHFLQPSLILAFVSFHKAKHSAASTIKHHLQAAGKVLNWWTTKAGGHDPGLDEMVKLWLPNLSEQVSAYRAVHAA